MFRKIIIIISNHIIYLFEILAPRVWQTNKGFRISGQSLENEAWMRQNLKRNLLEQNVCNFYYACMTELTHTNNDTKNQQLCRTQMSLTSAPLLFSNLLYILIESCCISQGQAYTTQTEESCSSGIDWLVHEVSLISLWLTIMYVLVMDSPLIIPGLINDLYIIEWSLIINPWLIHDYKATNQWLISNHWSTMVYGWFIEKSSIINPWLVHGYETIDQWLSINWQ